MSLLQRLVTVAVHNWPQKLGALVLAFVMWLAITSSSVTTTQRSMLVPLAAEGVQQSQVAVGVPKMVEVNVSGPSGRIDRLRADNVTATLDLSGLSGEFQQQVSVQTPGGVRLVGVSPNHVIGFLETVGNRDMAVTVALSGSPPSDKLLSLTARPSTVTLTGQQQALQKVFRVVAVAPAREGQARAHPYPVDDAGVPVQNVKVTPSDITIDVTAQAALVSKRVPIDLAVPSGTANASASLSQAEVEIAGPKDVLAGIASVKGTVQLPTPAPQPGRYTLPVKLDLPQGVSALSSPTAVLQVTRPASTP